MRFEPRATVPPWLILSAPIAAIILAFLSCSLLILWTGSPVWAAYGALLRGAVGSPFALTETLTRSIPLMLTGLSVAVCFRAKLWNIGAEGQFYGGALAASLLGTAELSLPRLGLVLVLLLAGWITGGLLLWIPAWLKTQFQVDEVVTTLLLNFVILLGISYLLEGPLKDPLALGWPQGPALPESALLPRLIPRSRLHAGFIIALLASLGVWALERFTVWGLEMRAVGANPEAAKFLGIPVQGVILYTSLLGGGLAGLAGVCELLGLKGYLTLDLSPGFGYTGIVVALLAQLHPLGVVGAAVFIAGIYVGADTMGRSLGVPTYLADVIVAAALLWMLVCMGLARYRLRWD